MTDVALVTDIPFWEPTLGSHARIRQLARAVAAEHALRVIYLRPRDAGAEQGFAGLELPGAARIVFLSDETARAPYGRRISALPWFETHEDAEQGGALAAHLAADPPGVAIFEYLRLAWLADACPAGVARALDLHDVMSARAVSLRRAGMRASIEIDTGTEMQVLRRFDRVLAISRADVTYLAERMGIEGALYVPYSVDLPPAPAPTSPPASPDGRAVAPEGPEAGSDTGSGMGADTGSGTGAEAGPDTGTYAGPGRAAAGWLRRLIGGDAPDPSAPSAPSVSPGPSAATGPDRARPGTPPSADPTTADAHSDADPDPAAPGRRLVFVGGGTAPNVTGLRWFLDQVWPLLGGARAGWRLDVVGTVCAQIAPRPAPPPRGAILSGTIPEDLLPGRSADARGVTGARPPLPDGVRLLGQRDDLSACLAAADIAINPVYAGGGLKIKCVDALAAGRPCVTTTEGASGLDAGRGAGLFVADDRAGFARALDRLARDPVARRAAGRAAQAYLRAEFSAGAAYAPLSDWLRARD